ncbi:hypothetical protein DT065_07315 [Salicibibacter kimchii]|uniref:Uncharacterized protein n=1 Tax=Salicibibacter kimchii TaxID=2099786 RepID=A0A345BY26_9BACI|nr:hypothetical protein DT065_07315 [Salicibibacter kimchii]
MHLRTHLALGKHYAFANLNLDDSYGFRATALVFIFHSRELFILWNQCFVNDTVERRYAYDYVGILGDLFSTCSHPLRGKGFETA